MPIVQIDREFHGSTVGLKGESGMRDWNTKREKKVYKLRKGYAINFLAFFYLTILIISQLTSPTGASFQDVVVIEGSLSADNFVEEDVEPSDGISDSNDQTLDEGGEIEQKKDDGEIETSSDNSIEEEHEMDEVEEMPNEENEIQEEKKLVESGNDLNETANFDNDNSTPSEKENLELDDTKSPIKDQNNRSDHES